MKEKDLLLEELRVLTEDMDIPVFRRESIVWLEKHLGKRNSDHPNFNKAMEIIKKLRKIGL